MLDYFKTLCTLRVQYMAQSPSRASLCDADNLYKKYDPFKQKKRAPNGELCLQTKFFCSTKRREIAGKPPCTPQMRATLLRSDWSTSTWRGTQTCCFARWSAVCCDLLYE